MNTRGSTSALILGMLLFLSVLFISGSVFIEISLRSLRRSREADNIREGLQKMAERVVQLLLEDPTPFADSPEDPVWTELKGLQEEDTSVTLEDASSFLGLNWIRKELLERLDVLKTEKTPGGLQQFREDTGIHLNLAPLFLDFIEEEDLSELFTSYNYFNINICDEFVLRKLYFLRTEDAEAAEVFHTEIQRARADKKRITPRELPNFLGQERYNQLFPILNAQPVMNIHFVPEQILTVLFNQYKVPLDKVKQIVSLREASEWTAEDIKLLIGKQYSKTVLQYYLGNTTWFWRITVTGQDSELRWMVARIPQPEGDGVPQFRLFERARRP